ncbi:MAG: ABC transporter substrate-binding protein [Prevotella sp.]|nr:ABC transporter substrate-binding protein [Prevotella sp.]
MKKIAGLLFVIMFIAACTPKDRQQMTAGESDNNAFTGIDVRYATGFAVRDTADIRLVSVGEKDRFALVHSDDVSVPDGYVKVRVPITKTICMTSLQLSNFTVLDAHDVVKGITGTKNLFNEDILARVADGRIVKIGMEGEFDTELVLAANPDVIFISPSKRGGYDAIKETGITLVPHLGYQELDPLGQAEWVKFVGMFIGKEREANEEFAGIEERYNTLKASVDSCVVAHASQRGSVAESGDCHAGKRDLLPSVFSGEMHYGNWHAVGGKNYLAQIFRDAGARYVINDDETAGENLEFEKLYSLAAKADYWRILNSFPGEFSYEALKASEPRNELFKAFKEKKVIYCNMKQQAYYEISPVQPDVLLKDFVAIFHPELVEPDYEPCYYRLLK